MWALVVVESVEEVMGSLLGSLGVCVYAQFNFSDVLPNPDFFANFEIFGRFWRPSRAAFTQIKGFYYEKRKIQNCKRKQEEGRLYYQKCTNNSPKGDLVSQN